MKHTLLMIAVALLLSGCEGSVLHNAFFADDDDDPQSSYSSGYSGSSSSYIYLITPQPQPQPTYQPPRMGYIISPPAPDSRTGQSTIQRYWY